MYAPKITTMTIIVAKLATETNVLLDIEVTCI